MTGTNFRDDVVIVGSGPTGLSTAIMLARRGYRNIKVFDRLPPPPSPNDSEQWSGFLADRSYNIGLNGRGQRTLRALGVMDKIDDSSAIVNGRKDWTPEAPLDSPSVTDYQGRSYVTKCIQRDRLTACLLDSVKENYTEAIAVHFSAACTEVKWENDGTDEETCVLSFHNVSGDTAERSWTERSKFVIGTDGAQSVVRDAMEVDSVSHKSFSVKKFKDTNARVYRTIPMHFPKDYASKKKWPTTLNYSARTKFDVNLDALPTKEGLYLGVVLYRPWDQKLKDIKSGLDARDFFNKYFPMFMPVVKDVDLEKFSQKNDSRLPMFQYCGPNLHR